MNEIQDPVVSAMDWEAGLDIAPLSLAGHGHCGHMFHTRALSVRPSSFTAGALRISLYRANGNGRRSFPLTFTTISNTAIDPAQMAAWTQSVAEWRWLTPAVVAFWVAGMLGFDPPAGRVQFTRRLRNLVRGAGDLATGIGPDRRANGQGAGSRGSSMVNVPAVIGYLQPIILCR